MDRILRSGPRRTLTRARSSLIALTGLWFGLPLLLRLFEIGPPIRFLVEFVAERPVVTFVVLVGSLLLATSLYPAREEGSKRRTVLPLLGLSLSLVSYGWLAGQAATDDMGGFLCIFLSLGFCCLLLCLAVPVRKSQHTTLLLLAPALLATQLLVDWSMHALERGRNRERGAQIVAALSAHRERTGIYPDTLDALIPHELDELPRPNKWFWAGSKYHYEPQGAREHRTYSIAYLTNGDFDFGAWRYTEYNGWVWEYAFGGAPAFEHPLPAWRTGRD